MYDCSQRFGATTIQRRNMMAKTKPARGAASEAIRGILDSGTEKTSEIKAALSKAGLSASDPLINNVRSRWRKAKGMPKARRGRKPGRKPGRKAASTSNGMAPATSSNGDVLDAAIIFCRSAGGLEKARRVLAQLDAIKNM